MAVHESQGTAEEDDGDSLFGSPPPPQIEGRAASPALALPSAASTHKSSSSVLNTPVSVGAGIQNVGTIALPGSQPNSEFPIHPLALSLNHSMVLRPPALPKKQSRSIAVSKSASTSRSHSTVTPSIAGLSRSTSRGSSKGRRPSQPRFQSEPATQHPLEFILPDPSAPPPVHFLRSQENLLGKAGRVGGITTALPQPRGSTPSNPILIDDDDDTPMIGRRNGSKSRETSQKPIDPMELAHPTNEEIVSVLVGQRDIFPVLESILKLIAKGAQPKQPPPRPTGFERRRPGWPKHEWVGPPTKKRKLNRVPAGATDWDVPFPFAEGEGPNAYQQNWERDRGKQLIAELIKLIKVASRKAAAKKYFAQQDGESREKDVDTSKNINGYYRPETALYDPQGSQIETGVMSKAGNPPQPREAVPPESGQKASTLQPVVPAPIPLQGDIQHSLDQLLSSFMESDFVPTRAATDVSQLPNSSDTMFDAWMNILNTFPIDPDGTGFGTQALSSETPNITTPLSDRSTPGIDGFSSSIPPDLDEVLNSIMETTPPIPTGTGDNLNSQYFFSSSLFDFTSVSQPSTSAQDSPTSLSLEFNEIASNPNPTIGEPLNPLFFMPSTGSSTSVNPCSGLTRPSPLPSASSESQAMTPASASLDLSSPDIFDDSSGDGEGQGEEPMDLGRDDFGEKGLDVDILSIQSPMIDKGKAKEAVQPLTTKIIETVPQFGPVTQSVFKALLSTKTRDELWACINGTAPSNTPPIAKSTKRSRETDSERARLRRKEDIIWRAKERRQEVQEGLNNIKRQLWDTTIEQAALIHLAKKLEVDSNEA